MSREENKKTTAYVLPDELYDLAFEFKKVKLWKKLWDSQIFAIRHSDGSTGYCSIMGKNGQHFAIGLYPESEGIGTYYGLTRGCDYMDAFDANELRLSQDCVMLSFENQDLVHPRSLEEIRSYCKRHGKVLRGANAYPCFERFLPAHHPWCLTRENDAVRIHEALEAALEVSRKLENKKASELGFGEEGQPGSPIPLLVKKQQAASSGKPEFSWEMTNLPEESEKVYPVGKIRDEVSLMRLRNTKKLKESWAVHVFMHLEAVSNEEPTAERRMPLEAPYYPYILLVCREKNGTVLAMNVSSKKADRDAGEKEAALPLKKDPQDYAAEFTNAFRDTILKNGKPERIHVIHERAGNLLDEICRQIEIKLEWQSANECLEDFLDNFMVQISGEDPDEDSLPEAMQEILQILESAQNLSMMSDEFVSSFSPFLDTDLLPAKAIQNLRKELKRRGLK